MGTLLHQAEGAPRPGPGYRHEVPGVANETQANEWGVMNSDFQWGYWTRRLYLSVPHLQEKSQRICSLSWLRDLQPLGRYGESNIQGPRSFGPSPNGQKPLRAVSRLPRRLTAIPELVCPFEVCARSPLLGVALTEACRLRGYSHSGTAIDILKGKYAIS
jgi:hypothetical protein